MQLFPEHVWNTEWQCRFPHVVSLSTSVTMFRDIQDLKKTRPKQQTTTKNLGTRKDSPLHMVKFKLYVVTFYANVNRELIRS